jgi:hypothetical protein
MLKRLTAIAAVSLVSFAASAGTTYGFESITNSNPIDVAIGQSQFTVEVKDGGNFVEFLFKNAGPEASSITSIYWNGENTVPGELRFDAWSTTTPGGVDYSGPQTGGFGADLLIRPSSLGGRVGNGVGPGEDLSAFITGGWGYEQVIDGLNSGGLTLGIQAQAFESGGGEFFTSTDLASVTPSPSVIPSPTAALAGVAIMSLLVCRRRRD